MNIGNVKFADPFISLAPLAGYGDIAFRRLCRDFGASLTTTEMVSVKGLVYGNEKTEELLKLAPNETPSCVQLFGSDPEFFTRALELPELAGFDIIDINMGCPVPKVTKCGEGSALMKNIPLAAEIVEACVKAAGGRPVTVKHRLGFGSRINAVEFASAMYNSGAAAITLHGRTAAEGYSGTADWDMIAKVAAAVKCPVIGNGDVCNEADVARALALGCGGVAIGRGALGNPLVFGGKKIPLKEVILKHINYSLNYLGERVAVSTMRKHLCKYFSGVPGTKELKAAANSATSGAQLIELIRNAEFEIKG